MSQREEPSSHSCSQVRALFERCLEGGPENWDALLAQECASAPELERQVRKLLDAHVKENPQLTTLVQRLARSADAWEGSGADDLELTPGADFEGYAIISLLGRGSFAAVYLARQPSLERLVALKLTRRMQEDEARVLARIEHQNVVRVHAVHAGVLTGRPVLAMCMQFISGPTLRDALRAFADAPASEPALSQVQAHALRQCFLQKGGPAPAALERGWEGRLWLLELAAQLASALHAAHEKEVVHLDVKPENILLDSSGSFLLADFNISLAKDRFARERLGGSARYMPPEQVALFHCDRQSIEGLARALDARADVFALGQVLREAAESLGCQDDRPIAALVERATKALPAERFAQARDFARAAADHLRLQRLTHALENTHMLARVHAWIASHPWSSLIVALFVPNAIAGALQVFYNYIHILSRLTQEQRTLFDSILAPWNLFVLAVALFLLVLYYLPVVRALRAVTRGESAASLLPPAKDSLLAAFGKASRAIILGWSCACLVFILALSRSAGGLTRADTVHFLVSFAIGLAIPLTLSRLFVAYVHYVVFFPALLRNAAQPALLLRSGHPPDWPRITWLKHAGGIACLLGACVVVVAGPGFAQTRVAQTGVGAYETLAFCFLLAAAASFIAGAELTDRVAAAVHGLEELVLHRS